jgi:hypothetical protein
MTTPRKKTIATSLPLGELAEFDRIREEYNLTRSQALREAGRPRARRAPYLRPTLVAAQRPSRGM